jgi:hypothetical protein
LKGPFTRNMIFVLHRVARQRATKVRINPKCGRTAPCKHRLLKGKCFFLCGDQ